MENEQNKLLAAPKSEQQIVPQQPTEITPVKDAGIVQEKTKKFNPSPIQIEWISAGFRLGTQRASAIALELTKTGSKETTDTTMWYRWKQDPGFRSWWAEQWTHFYEMEKHMLIDAGMKQATKDHTWWRDMMEYFGLLQPRDINPAVPPTASPNTQINIMAEAFMKGAKERGVDVEQPIA